MGHYFFKNSIRTKLFSLESYNVSLNSQYRLGSSLRPNFEESIGGEPIFLSIYQVLLRCCHLQCVHGTSETCYKYGVVSGDEAGGVF
jgi:hypothetical protein